jgi:hypothetical protein
LSTAVKRLRLGMDIAQSASARARSAPLPLVSICSRRLFSKAQVAAVSERHPWLKIASCDSSWLSVPHSRVRSDIQGSNLRVFFQTRPVSWRALSLAANRGNQRRTMRRFVLLLWRFRIHHAPQVTNSHYLRTVAPSNGHGQGSGELVRRVHAKVPQRVGDCVPVLDSGAGCFGSGLMAETFILDRSNDTAGGSNTRALQSHITYGRRLAQPGPGNTTPAIQSRDRSR